MAGVGKGLILIGIVIVMLGVLFVIAPKISFVGRLPGDFVFRRGDTTFAFPVATSILVSILLTIVINVIFRIFRS